jgi:dihydrolipoamide dehydrogenase
VFSSAQWWFSLEKSVDALVLGGGPGGYVSAIRLSQLGKKVILVEQGEIGGNCLNRGCVPTKALIHVSRLVKEVKHGERMGIKAPSIEVDFPRVQAWNRSVVDRFRRGVEYLLRANGVEVVKGAASFESANAVVVQPQGDRIKAEIMIIATGSRPSDLPVLRVDSKRILSSDDIFLLSRLPKEMVIVGGGVIGVEMATALASLGTKVSVVEIMKQILPNFSREIIDPVSDALRKLSVEIHLDTKVVEAKYSGSGEKVQLRLESGVSLEADYILVSVGRKPNTDDLNLQSTGVNLDKKGFVKVDNRLETSAQGVFAVGDVTGMPYLAHRAMEQGYYAAEIASGIIDMLPPMHTPTVVYSDPEIALVGIDEQEAARRGIEVVTGKFPFVACARSLTMGRTDGFVKLIGDRSSGELLGAQTVGPGVSELISECAVALTASLTLKEIAEGVHPHPTLSEAIVEAAKIALGRPVHYSSKGT